ncbi:hypothetical protein [Flavobacterium limi]|uniref:Uncharacterized protein n=1 Tax=Flavobacterium limi TaxID=2045105 RepID=A0ABQ1U8N4_9FLAO|nr:hypothetical protein [Flavobacterium limi]GGF12792.1 hypothetical protein GCM10011518_22560 [Flavobacterium limi]
MIFESWLQQLAEFNLAYLAVFSLVENLVLIYISVLIGRIIEPENTILKSLTSNGSFQP